MMDPREFSRGTVQAIAYRPTDGDPMVQIDVVTVLPGRGITLENRKPGKREITLLSAQSWAETCAELRRDIPWWVRRANLLIDGIVLADTIGKRLRISDVEILIHGETKPCKNMHAQVPGLTRALAKDFRGGVYGQVLSEGAIRVGAAVRLVQHFPQPEALNQLGWSSYPGSS